MSNRSLYWGDIELYFAPMQQFLRDSLSYGRLPLWNPLILCGQPYVGNPQTFVLYPASILVPICSAWKFVTIDAGLHLILGGIFVFALARDSARSRAASVLAALSFMLGGFFVAKIQFPNMTQAIAYMPAVIWQTRRLVRSQSPKSAVALGLLIGLQLLSAHMQIAVMTAYLALAVALFTAWSERIRGRILLLRIAGLAFSAIVLGCGLAAGELLPTVETWLNADHQTLSIAAANRFFLIPGQQIGLIYPWAFGAPYFANFTQLGNFWECACYLGVAPCLLMLVGMFDAARRRTPETVFWTVVFVASLWLAEGRLGGLYTFAFYAAPGLRSFHDPARMLMGVAIAGPMLAAFGFDGLIPAGLKTRRLAIASLIIAATAVDLGSFDRCVYPLKPTADLESAVAASRLAAPLALPGHRVAFQPDNRATWDYFVDYSDYRQRDTAYLGALFATHTSDLNMFSNTMDAGGYEPEPPKGAAQRFVRAYQNAGAGDFSAADALCVDSIVGISAGGEPQATGFLRMHSVLVRRNPDAGRLTRARLADGRYVPVDDLTPDAVDVRIPPIAQGETLTLADTDMPGWRAFELGRQVPIRRTSDGMRQIDLRRSSSPEVIHFRYRPAAWTVGLYISLICLALVLGCAAHAVLSLDRKTPPYSAL